MQPRFCLSEANASSISFHDYAILLLVTFPLFILFLVQSQQLASLSAVIFDFLCILYPPPLLQCILCFDIYYTNQKFELILSIISFMF
jgi:hypothetical protein